MTESEYRKHPAISRSELWGLSESPEKFRYKQDHPDPPTPALIFGRLLHAMVLQPETVSDQFAVSPIVDRRTKAGKEEWATFFEKSSGKEIVDPMIFSQAEEMCFALSQNEFVRRLLVGKKEQEFFWTDDLTGEECKIRLDCYSEIGDEIIISDLKTTECAETESFIRSAIKYGYDFQAAMYSEGFTKNTGKNPLFVFIAIEKKQPYAINILQADPLFLRRGYDTFRELIGIYHDCKQSGNWYGYLGRYNQINNLALPAWLAKEVE